MIVKICYNFKKLSTPCGVSAKQTIPFNLQLELTIFKIGIVTMIINNDYFQSDIY